MSKKIKRIRRGAKTKAIQRYSTRPRLVVHRSAMHIYAQIVVPEQNGNKVLASASTLDKEIKPVLSGSKIDRAIQVGKLLAKRAIALGITDIAFDRNGYKFHGRVRALAESVREETGLNF